MFSIFKKIPAYVYDLIISNFLTITSHIIMMTHLKFKETDTDFLDVGCGTGSPLKKIIDFIPQKINIVGVDIDKSYILKCKQIFSKISRVQIHEKSFYDIKDLNKKYDIIFFSFSFMVLPKKIQALRQAKNHLKQNGRICFLLTLNKNKNALIEKIKPLIKLITTIDFGNVVYEQEFLDIIKSENLKIKIKERIYSRFNPLLWIFPVNYIQIEA